MNADFWEDKKHFHPFYQPFYTLMISYYYTRNTSKINMDIEDARKFLFPQILEVVWQYIEQRVEFIEAPPQEIALIKYTDEIKDRITNAIVPDTNAGEAPLLPIIERFRPKGSTSEVLFRTVRPCHGTSKSHVSHVVLDSTWENTVAYQLEKLDSVIAYARNDHLDLNIHYEFEGVRHSYTPDFLVRVKRKGGSEVNVILEVKGYEDEKDRAKEAAALRWVSAVNNHKGFGYWVLVVCKDPRSLLQKFHRLIESEEEE